jgi:uncharacterized repeat protein (TIGR02543 family)
MMALLLLLTMTASVSANAPGTTGNPVVTRRYIEDVHIPSVRTKARNAATNRLNYNRQLSNLQYTAITRGRTINEAALAQRVTSRLTFRKSGRVTLKKGATLVLGQGTSVSRISGTVRHTSGTMVNSTRGQEIASGASLPKNHRVFALAANAQVTATANSVVMVYGTCRLVPPNTKYTVTFNVNGGNALSASRRTKSVNHNAQLGSRPTPTREGYTFNGWFTKKTDGTKVTSSTRVINRRTYYAQWTINRTVTFHPNGGDKLSVSRRTKEVTHRAELGSRPTPKREGYAFKGWFTRREGGTRINSKTIITANRTYYAQWTPIA